MPCDPGAIDINLNPTGPITIPGIGVLQAPPQLPIPDFNFPEGFPQLLSDLVEQIFARFPSGIFRPSLDSFGTDILKALSDLFSQIAPYLSFYNFILAALDMILCILEVLCALPDPFSTLRALRKLFKRCIPNFLSLFPFFALLSMIIAILLLILALVEYIIARFLALINDLIQNLELLINSLNITDVESTTAVVLKIASLLCLIENLFTILGALSGIFGVIQSLASFGGRKTCATPGDVNGDDFNCCPEESCPSFISENFEIPGEEGRLIYYNKINSNPGSSQFFSRSPSWQFINTASVQEYEFKDIITSVNGGGIFWPGDQQFLENTVVRQAPYTVDITLENFNPDIFDNNIISSSGIGTYIIRGAIVKVRPYIGVFNEENKLEQSNNRGTLSLTGGFVFKQVSLNQEQPVIVSGNTQATIDNFIFFNDNNSGQIPASDDGYVISNISYEWKINHAALLNYNLISYGCPPDIRAELDVINAQFNDTNSVIVKLGGNFLPDLDSTLTCLQDALFKLRSNITLETAELFRSEVLDCLNKFQSETTSALCNALVESVDPFQSTISIVPDIQFINNSIDVKVTLLDVNRTNISLNLPTECADNLSSKLKGEVTLGEISNFTYNADGFFESKITSSKDGLGELIVSFDGNIFSNVLNRDNDEDTTIEENVIKYEFIGLSNADDQIRTKRDETDIANN